MRSYVTQYANSSRNSRVRLPRPAVASLSAVAQIAPDRPVDPRFIRAAFVLTSPEGKHVVVNQADDRRLYDASGKVTGVRAARSDSNELLSTHGVFAGAYQFPWEMNANSDVIFVDGWRGADSSRSYGIADWAIWSDAGGLVIVWQRKQGGEVGPSEPAMIVTALQDRFDPQLGRKFVQIWEDLHLKGEGCGAIGPDGRAVVAMVDGRFVVYAAELSPRQQPGGPIALETKIPYFAYDVSVIEPGYALLSSARTEEILPSPHAREVRERLYRLRHARGSWPTRLHRHDAGGREVWSLDVSLSVRQPPIDGGGGRIYLAGGNGVIAIDDGKIAWQHLGSHLMMATAFEDGSLAVSNGPNLEILGRDGQVVQSFATARKEPITTPPAPASDGSIWLATAEALYVAR